MLASMKSCQIKGSHRKIASKGQSVINGAFPSFISEVSNTRRARCICAAREHPKKPQN
jgi:hypothetical protein